MSRNLVKVMKYELRYVDGLGDFHRMQEAVWQVARQVRQIMNRTVQMCYHFDDMSREHFRHTGSYLDVKQETGYKTYSGYVYQVLRGEFPFVSSNIASASIRKAYQKYKNDSASVMRGTVSLPSFGADQPIPIPAQNIRLTESDGETYFSLPMLSREWSKEHEADARVRFRVIAADGARRRILSGVLTGEYGLAESAIVYQKRKWYLLLSYKFTKEDVSLDKDKILGVDAGQVYALYAASSSGKETLVIDGGEVEEFARRTDGRTYRIQRQRRYCGDGSVGRGTKCRTEAAFRAGTTIKNFRDTINHRYSKALVDFAVKHGYGTIQMENLSGIKTSQSCPRQLRHWTYYDLQSKIEAKAAEAGLSVIKVKPQYTSQRCFACGHIDPENRKDQAHFLCTRCGHRDNADHNAAMNLSLKDIERIIQEEIGANLEHAS